MSAIAVPPLAENIGHIGYDVVPSAGAVLESVAWSGFWQDCICKYWIEVTP